MLLKDADLKRYAETGVLFPIPVLTVAERRLVSAWIALSESTVENGCMRVQTGTHLSRLDHTEVHHENNLLGTGATITAAFDEARAVDVVLGAGEMSFHHANVVHGSGPN